jgi:hypothetical protein
MGGGVCSRIYARTIAKVFVDEIICRHSAPEVLLSDQGAQFMAKLVKEVCDFMMTKKINTSAYHPICNGLTERFNASLCQLLSMYCSENQTDWDQFIPTAVFAYQVSEQATTGIAPFKALYGREPRLPSDLDKFHKNEVITDFQKRTLPELYWNLGPK